MSVARRTLAVLLAVLIAPAIAMAGETETSSKIQIGGWDASVDGSPDVAAEYLSADGGLNLKAGIKSVYDDGSFAAWLKVRDDNDFNVGLNFDMGRSFRFDTTFTGVPHRLGHNPLDYFEAASNHGRVAERTDHHPGAVYEVDYQLLESRIEYQPKSYGNLTLGFDYRDQTRDGQKQKTVASHCGSCHVVSQTRPMDESTTDTGFDALFAFEKGQVLISAVSRSFKEGVSFINFLFDDALHPEKRLPLFDNRLQYDEDSGPQMIGLVPDIDKDTFNVGAQFGQVGGFYVTADGIWSTTDNKYTGVSSDYSGYLLTASKRLNKKVDMRWRGRAYSVDTDDFWVETVEPLGIAGPQGGKTYRDIYGFNPDFLRQSSTNRDVLESNLDFNFRVGKKGKVRAFWEYEEIDREHFVVSEAGSTSTTTNVLGATYRTRFGNGVKTNFVYKHGQSDDPFLAVNDKVSTLISPGPFPSPFVPDAAQYYVFQDSRVGEGAGTPADWDEFEARVSKTGKKSTISGSYRYWDGDNSEGDFNSFAKTQQAATITLWSAPAEDWEWHAAWSWNSSEQETYASIPIFDG